MALTDPEEIAEAKRKNKEAWAKVNGAIVKSTLIFKVENGLLVDEALSEALKVLIRHPAVSNVGLTTVVKDFRNSSIPCGHVPDFDSNQSCTLEELHEGDHSNGFYKWS